MVEIPQDEDLRALFDVHCVKLGVPFLLFSHLVGDSVRGLKDIEEAAIKRQDMIWERFLDFATDEIRFRYLDIHDPEIQKFLFPLVTIFLEVEKMNSYRRRVRMNILGVLNDVQCQNVKAHFPEIF